VSDALVRLLIERRFSDYAVGNDYPVQWEDKPFTVPTTEYLKFNLLPAPTRSDDLAGKHRAWIGVAQTAIAVPSGAGPAKADLIAGELDAWFPCGTGISSDPAVDGIALTVMIMTPLARPSGFSDKSYYFVPAYFNYRADYFLP